MTLRTSWVRAQRQLASCGIADAAIEAEVLHRHALSMDREEFFASLDNQLALSQEELPRQYVRRRIGGEPLAYIVGHREFYGLDFYVSSSVLIPRQETELLVDKVLEFSEGMPEQDLTIADIGTGSGAIAIAIAHHLSKVTVHATDISRQALHVADANRRRHGVIERVHLQQGNLLDALREPVDVIVSNPPYIRTDEVTHLPPDVRREPLRALHGGPDGLSTIGRLLRQAHTRLRPGGLLLVEIAPRQLERVLEIGQGAFPSARVSSAQDYLGLPRVVSIGLPREDS